jgi:hypothetical protein
MTVIDVKTLIIKKRKVKKVKLPRYSHADGKGERKYSS